MRLTIHVNVQPKRSPWGWLWGVEKVKLTRGRPRVELPDSRTFEVELEIPDSEFHPVPMHASVVR